MRNLASTADVSDLISANVTTATPDRSATKSLVQVLPVCPAPIRLENMNH